MDLWVRDSTKTKLIKVDNVYLKKLDTSIFEPKLLKYQGIDYIYCIFTNNECLGEYNSEERAMKILDEIQKILIQDVIIFKNIDIGDSTELSNYLESKCFAVLTQDKKEQVEFINRDCVVFEMPEN